MRVALYGSRPDGHAKVVLDVLGAPCELEVVGLIDDWPENAQREVRSIGVIGGAAELPRLAAEGEIEGVVLGFGAAQGREEAVSAVVAAGLSLPTLVHPSAYVASTATLCEGVQVLPNAVVGAEARVGRGGLVNTAAVLDHDVRVGDYAVVNPGAVLTGRVRVGAASEIGAGAVAIPDVSIGTEATVGAGAVVIRDVPDGITVAGVPARVLKRS